MDSYCLTGLKRSTQAYGLTQALDGAIAVIRSSEINVGLLGVGAAVSPGEVLSAPHDSVKTLSSNFFMVIMVFLVGKQAAGMISYFCFKILMPVGLVFLLAHRIFGGACASFKSIGLLLLKTDLVLWAALPAAALAGTVIEDRYIAPKYEAHAEALGEKIKAVAELTGISFLSDGNLSLKDIAKFGLLAAQSAKESIKAGENAEHGRKMQELSQLISDICNILLVLFSMLALTTYVVPLVVLGLGFGVFIIVIRAEA